MQTDRLAAWITRATGVGFALYAGFAVLAAGQGGGGASLVLAVIAVGLALGLCFLHPAALKIAPAILVLLAMVLPVGIINPFAAMEAPTAAGASPGHAAGTIALGVGASALCLFLAFMVGRARRTRASAGKK